MATTESCRVIPFPGSRLWSRAAEQYVNYMTRGDPRASAYFLESVLLPLGLRSLPPDLRLAIDREYLRRGFRSEIHFSKEG